MSTTGRPLAILAGRFSNRKPYPGWLLGPTAFVTAASAASSRSMVELFRDMLCRSHEPDPTKDCADDAYRKLYWGSITVVIILSTTLLSWITAGWWGSLSDRYGRTRILTWGITGSLFSYVSLIVAHLIGSNRVPYIYWLVIDGAIVQGALGGLTTITAVTQAYIVDTTTEINRATTLSIYLGLSSLGAFVGAISAEALDWRFSIRTLYVLAGVHSAYAFYVCMVVPDSVTDEEKSRAQQSYESARNPEEHTLKSVRRVASLVNPLSLLGPTAANTSGNPLRHGGKDWSLALLVLGLSLTFSGSRAFELRVFGSLFSRWGNSPLNVFHWVAAAQVFAFLVLLPVIKRSRTAYPLVASESVSTQAGYHSIFRDLKIRRISLGVLFVGHIILSLFPYSLPNLALPGLLGLLGVIFRPALTSIIVSTHTRQNGKEIGRLLGGLGVIQGISEFIGTYLILPLHYSPTSAIIPFVILVTSYSILCRVRVPEIDLGTERRLDEEERLVGDD